MEYLYGGIGQAKLLLTVNKFLQWNISPKLVILRQFYKLCLRDFFNNFQSGQQNLEIPEPLFNFQEKKNSRNI